jgi:hypothetical protein
MIESRRVRWLEYVARTEEKKNPYIVLVGKVERRRSHARSTNRWKNNIEQKDMETRGVHVAASIYWQTKGFHLLLTLQPPP